MTLTWLNRRSDPILELQLHEGGLVKETLQLNPIQESVRIRCDGYHQVFFLDKGNAWNDQLSFNNAYGIRAGIMQFERYPSLTGILQLEDQEFICSHSRKKNTIDIYKAGASEIHLSALLPLEDNIPVSSIAIPDKKVEMDATVLLALCWHLLRMPEFEEIEIRANYHQAAINSQSAFMGR